jgi:hypothetical protein
MSGMVIKNVVSHQFVNHSGSKNGALMMKFMAGSNWVAIEYRLQCPALPASP